MLADTPAFPASSAFPPVLTKAAASTLLAQSAQPPMLTQASASTLLTVSTQPPMLAATASHAFVASLSMVTQTDAPALLAVVSLSPVRTPALVRFHCLVVFRVFLQIFVEEKVSVNNTEVIKQ